MNYEYFHEGGASSLSPDYGNFTGYRIPGAQLGQSMNPATANQLGETVKTLKTGVQEVEVQMLGSFGGQPDVDQQIPIEHFREMRSLLKLSGARASLHGPLLDPAGFGQRGANEATREETERRFMDTLEKAKELDPDGNIPVVFHSSNGSPGPIYKVDEEKKPGEKGRLVVEQNFAVNQDTGEAVPLNLTEQYTPLDLEGLEGKGVAFTPEEQLRSSNTTEWRRTMTSLAEYNKHAEEVFKDAPIELAEFKNAIEDRNSKKIIDLETNKELELTDQQRSQIDNMNKAGIFLENIELQFNNAFDTAFKYGSPEQKEKLKELAEDYTKHYVGLQSEQGRAVLAPIGKQQILQGSIAKLNEITRERDDNGKSGVPEKFIDAQKYALDKSSETFSNVATDAYEKFGDKMPVIAIENVFPGMAFHRAEDLNRLIEESRDKFAEKLQDEKGLGKGQAKQVAKKHIGATWDVGHINLYKKYGWTNEDLIKETEEISGNIKHLHLTDNFGHSDSHLVPGMGNVPIKKHLEKLEKAGVLDKVKKVVEAGGYIQQFSNAGVHGESLSAFGSAIYGAKMGGYWNQTLDVRGNYFGGYGTINPTQHHNLYGAGFTTLPMELGGNVPGGNSRFSGNSLS